MFIFPLPRWLELLPEGREKERAKGRFFLKLAILYASQKGHTRYLADTIGVSYSSLKSQIITQPTYETCRRIGDLLGPNFTPPKLPDLRLFENRDN